MQNLVPEVHHNTLIHAGNNEEETWDVEDEVSQ